MGGIALAAMSTKRFKVAEHYIVQALEIEPNKPVHYCNYAELLFLQGKTKEGEQKLERALAMSKGVGGFDSGLLHLMFAHVPERREEALSRLKEALKAGVRSAEWIFDKSIQRAIADGHPEPELLQKLADVINEKADISELDEFEAWRNA